jgi:bacterioferritin
MSTKAKKAKKVSSNEEIVALLRDDMKGEHAAIIQYLQHAYKMEEGKVPNDIEGIARDEMRHFRWLGELVVELGGNPTMERDPIYLATKEDYEFMLLDVEAEDRAIEQYEAHLAAIDHPKVQRFIERILVDERTHREKFKGFVEELGGDPEKKLNPAVGPWDHSGNTVEQNLELNTDGQAINADMDGKERDDHPLVKLLNNRVRLEYMTILSYLHRAFVAWDKNPKLSRILIEDHAIWHMTHMGNISEAVAGLKVVPEMVIPALPIIETGVKNGKFVKWAIDNEGKLADNTVVLLEKLKEDEQKAGEESEDLELELKRIEKHDRFMQSQFEEDLD